MTKRVFKSKRHEQAFSHATGVINAIENERKAGIRPSLHDILGRRVGNFDAVSYIRRFGNSDSTYLVLVYGAYNAMGLIGPEFNGVAILDETNLRVVVRQHCPAVSGYNCPTEKQVQEVDRLIGLSFEEFEEFLEEHGE